MMVPLQFQTLESHNEKPIAARKKEKAVGPGLQELSRKVSCQSRLEHLHPQGR